ncbi:unnamed protein product, partial [Pylaiella littoralis]
KGPLQTSRLTHTRTAHGPLRDTIKRRVWGMSYLPDSHNHQLHTKVEVLNRHAVDLPERVARLPKELESRESEIPYDYDLSLEDPQYREIHNSIVELEVTVLSAVQS